MTESTFAFRDWLTVPQSSDLSGYCETWIRILIERETLPAVKVGRDYFVLKSELTHYLDSPKKKGGRPKKI